MTEVLMRFPGGWEWIIILIVVLLIFGPGRLSKIAGEIAGVSGNSDLGYRGKTRNNPPLM